MWRIIRSWLGLCFISVWAIAIAMSLSLGLFPLIDSDTCLLLALASLTSGYLALAMSQSLGGNIPIDNNDILYLATLGSLSLSGNGPLGFLSLKVSEYVNVSNQCGWTEFYCYMFRKFNCFVSQRENYVKVFLAILSMYFKITNHSI